MSKLAFFKIVDFINDKPPFIKNLGRPVLFLHISVANFIKLLKGESNIMQLIEGSLATYNNAFL